MRKLLFTLCLLPASAAFAQVANHVVISEIYGGGGNSGATFTHDFIELYNPTATPVSLTGWSVQYASATGNTWQKTDLTGTIPAYGFFLVQGAAGTGGTTPLPTPDVSGTLALAGTGGKLALVNNNTLLTGACPAGAQIIDFAGFATNTSCNEGGSNTPAPSNTTSVERKASATSTAASLAPAGADASAGNGYDSNVNGADFVSQSAVNPQNSSSTTEGGIAGNAVTAVAGNNAAEPATNGSFTISLSSPAPVGGVTITYSLSGTATAADYTDPGAGSILIPEAATSGTVTINVTDDVLTESNETIILTLLTATAGYTVSPATATINITDNDIATSLIHNIQGTGATAIAGTYTAEAIVTGVYPLLSPAGFYIQEEDADADADPATSEGIFVVSAAPVAVGDRVRVTGTVQESSATPSFGQAVFNAPAVTVLNNNLALPAVTNINLPVTAVTDFERYEGMLVAFPATLTVTNNYTLGRFGEVGLSAGGAVYQPSQVTDPNDASPDGTTATGASNVAAINALMTANAVRTILLDDGTNTTVTLPYADPVDHTLRLGSTIANLTGIMGYAFNLYRIQPIPSVPPAFTYAPRPALPSVGAGNIKVASFNVLNYFNGNGTGGGFPTERGAHSLVEFNRQRAKIISAIAQINADVVGLLEIENDGTGANSAIQDLVNGLNAAMGAGTYSIVNDGASIQTFGTDAIRCGLIYKPASVTPVGAPMLSASDSFSRPPLVQTFNVAGAAQLFNFAVNHFKSKGCSGSAGADLDQLDGQACYNDRRKKQSVALLNFFNNTVIPTSGTDRIITVGDYNAYYEEDPLDMMRAAGYTVLSSATNYSYQFDGQIGSLDHAIVSSSLNSLVTGAAKWNINAAEPVYLDYNDQADDGGSDIANPFGNYYTAVPYRSSDHDPVIIGINLTTPLPVSLSRFTAVKKNNTVVLNWTTAQEENSKEFIVERSAEGTQWHNIAQVAATGKSSLAVDYTATDAYPLTGVNLYRLKLVDQDGQFTYSPVRKLSFGPGSDYRVYPNPAGQTLYITCNTAIAGMQVQVVNMMNQMLVSKVYTASGADVAIDVAALPAGIYGIRIIAADGTTSTSRFVKK